MKLGVLTVPLSAMGAEEAFAYLAGQGVQTPWSLAPAATPTTPT